MNTMEPNKKLILLVDDIPKNLQLLGSFLSEELNAELSFAASGKEALDVVNHAMPDLILLDIMMPGMDGYEVCRILQSDDSTSLIPVIFLTAKVETEDIVKGFQTGAVDYITKPFNRHELIARVNTHLKIKQLQDDLRAAIQTKDKFFSIIAHDLKGPIGSFLQFTQMLAAPGRMSEEGKERLIASMQETSRTTYTLLENLLYWSRAQTGRLQLEPKEIHVQTLIRENFELLGSQAETKKIRLINKCGKKTKVYADENTLRTVLRNLLSNAIKFTASKGKVTVADATAEGKNGDNRVTLSVSDTGVGIPEDKINTLFRIDKSYSTPGTADEQGTGLGLIVCKEFVEKNQGTLSVESRDGEGTTFRVTLPAST